MRSEEPVESRKASDRATHRAVRNLKCSTLSRPNLFRAPLLPGIRSTALEASGLFGVRACRPWLRLASLRRGLCVQRLVVVRQLGLQTLPTLTHPKTLESLYHAQPSIRTSSPMSRRKLLATKDRSSCFRLLRALGFRLRVPKRGLSEFRDPSAFCAVLGFSATDFRVRVSEFTASRRLEGLSGLGLW